VGSTGVGEAPGLLESCKSISSRTSARAYIDVVAEVGRNTVASGSAAAFPGGACRQNGSRIAIRCALLFGELQDGRPFRRETSVHGAAVSSG
jgi:hypothetical protein